MNLPAGKLRHRIALDEKRLQQDPITGATETHWCEVRSLWAHVSPLSGREIMAAASEYSKVTTRIQVRYRDDIDATMRIRHRGRLYNIHAVLPDAESGLEWLTLLCSEGVNDGR